MALFALVFAAGHTEYGLKFSNVEVGIFLFHLKNNCFFYFFIRHSLRRSLNEI